MAERIDGRCAWCLDWMPVPDREQGGGRSKKFCSPACKQAEYRHRKQPERYPDAQTWTLARRGPVKVIRDGQGAWDPPTIDRALGFRGVQIDQGILAGLKELERMGFVAKAEATAHATRPRWRLTEAGAAWLAEHEERA
jgi:hypothetical protein